MVYYAYEVPTMPERFSGKLSKVLFKTLLSYIQKTDVWGLHKTMFDLWQTVQADLTIGIFQGKILFQHLQRGGSDSSKSSFREKLRAVWRKFYTYREGGKQSRQATILLKGLWLRQQTARTQTIKGLHKAIYREGYARSRQGWTYMGTQVRYAAKGWSSSKTLRGSTSQELKQAGQPNRESRASYTPAEYSILFSRKGATK